VAIFCAVSAASPVFPAFSSEHFFEEITMKIWLVSKLAQNDPQQRVYLLGAHSSREAAVRHRKEVDDPARHTTHIIEMMVDDKQSPVLVGAAIDDMSDDCKHNLPNG
jgi:hypothetical protein